MSAKWGPYAIMIVWGEEERSQRLSLRACAEAKLSDFSDDEAKRFRRLCNSVLEPARRIFCPCGEASARVSRRETTRQGAKASANPKAVQLAPRLEPADY